jgi:ATP-dependent Lon protease
MIKSETIEVFSINEALHEMNLIKQPNSATKSEVKFDIDTDEINVQDIDPLAGNSRFNFIDEPLISPENQARYRSLQKFQNDELSGSRIVLFADEEMLNFLDLIDQAMPNMREVTEVIRLSVKLSLATNTSLDIAPIILNGPPGVGKTRFVKLIAKALLTSFTNISVNQLTDPAILTGKTTVWQGATFGLIAKALFEAENVSPVILLDELDKFNQHNRNNSNPLDNILHTLFEEENASEFTDEYLNIKFRAEHIIWFATTNDIQNISESLLDRVQIFDVPELTHDQKNTVVQNIFNELCSGMDRPLTITPEAITEIAKTNLRHAKRLLKTSMGYAIHTGTKTVAASHVKASHRLTRRKNDRQSIGFTN